MEDKREPVIGPLQIILPDGEIITVDGVPYEGWGYEPGKWYTVIQVDDEGAELWRRNWVIPVPGEPSPAAKSDSHQAYP